LIPAVDSPAPTPKSLTDADAKRVEDLKKTMEQLRRAGKFTEAIELAKQVLAICERVLGSDHWLTDEARRSIECHRDYARLPKEGRQTIASVDSLEEEAKALENRVKYADAERIRREVLEILHRWLGEGHPDTVASYGFLALNLSAQGRYAEAQPLLQRGLDIRRQVLGENHPWTAISYGNLALNLNAQGRYAEAQPLFHRALDIRRKALGESHLHTAIGYNNLALNLDEQGRYAEAQPLFQRALDIHRKALGEGRPDTATCYSNLAYNLDAQGRYTEAQPLLQRALDIRRQALGEGHPDTARGYHNLAMNLDAQGQHAAAQPLLQRALEIYRQALSVGHPDSAACYHSLAVSLDEQGRYTEAQPLFQRALDIRRQALGEGHPDTSTGYHNLALNLEAQGRLQEAMAHWKAAAESLERSRRALSSSGLERAQVKQIDPLSASAIALARQDQGREAWRYWESSLARGLLDDLSARQLRPLTVEQRSQEADFLGQLQRLEEQIGKLAAKPRRSEDDRRLEQLRNHAGTLRGRFLELEQALEARYGAFAGKPTALKDIQAALPADAALVGWIDLRPRGPRPSYHWACVVRKYGDPAWVKIPGSSKDGDWTKEDDRPVAMLRDALARNLPAWRGLAAQVVRQRLEPVVPDLKEVKRLIILPSQDLASVPIEVLVAAGSAELSKLVVSYAPSGTMLARLIQPRSGDAGPPRLLALGDPAYGEPEPEAAPPTPPDHGIAILAVQPYSAAHLAEIQRGDVLLEYNGKILKSAADLEVVPAEAGPRRIPVKLWRHGEVRTLDVSAGPLGINPHREGTAAEAILAQHEGDKTLRPLTRGQNWDRLPGTRREVETIAGLFPDAKATTLLGSKATESAVQRLVASGELAHYRYLHFATHGWTNPAVAMSSAIILAPDADRFADPTALETDGQITAQQIVQTWKLDADLVVLSACQSSLGRYAGGEGYLGFSQALFVAGARAVVLSLWEVNDESTALLMQRFYENLLGRRAGLAGAMPKAEALSEAKQWLRMLTAKQLADLTRSNPRPARRRAAQAATRRSYDHPYYWAAFILIGDPD
jgi:CHAT domain-containing protein/tetratricopeptide (TPR) repeat protein